MMGVVLLWALETRKLFTSLYGMLVGQQWFQLQVAPKQLGKCLLDLQDVTQSVPIKVENKVKENHIEYVCKTNNGRMLSLNAFFPNLLVMVQGHIVKVLASCMGH